MLLKSPESIEDVDNIWLTIALDKPQSADKFVNDIEEKFKLLEYSQFICRLYNSTSKKYPNMRIFPFGKYMIL